MPSGLSRANTRKKKNTKSIELEKEHVLFNNMLCSDIFHVHVEAPSTATTHSKRKKL